LEVHRTSQGHDPELRDRMRGALIGLAVGDAVGTTVEFKTPGSFPPVTDMVGGGPFRLAAGEWTDDTSMALCLAESLIEGREFDPVDQMKRYTKWYKHGHLSSNGRCFDIGNTVSEALARFAETKDPFAGSRAPNKAGNGSLMRLAPIPMFYFGRAAAKVRCRWPLTARGQRTELPLPSTRVDISPR
jgi:ADP-ribosyl-[dinitrogen reductase] hydrolase